MNNSGTKGRARFGIYLPPRKRRIVEAVAAAGDLGISCQELTFLWEPPVSRHTVKSHINQINDLLEETDWLIRSESEGKRPDDSDRSLSDRRLYFMRRRRVSV